MANEMAEFLKGVTKRGGLLKISKLRGGIYRNFRSQGGGIVGYTPFVNP